MGCKQSKDAIQTIEIKDGEVKKASAKKIKVVSSEENVLNEANATYVGIKSTSAKSRDSGIEEMDYGKNILLDGVITEESDPNLVQGIENENRPHTPELELVGRQFQTKSAGRLRSKAILEELEAEGLISGSKIERGGAAFEVRVGPHQPLEPLAPIQRLPPRLQRMKSEKKILSKEELEEKMKRADDRRKEKLDQKSRLASQLARDQALAMKFHNDNNHEEDHSDNADIVTKPMSAKIDYGQGEGENGPEEMRTVFDEKSSESSANDATDGLTDSTDAFFNDRAPSESSNFS